jgi:hypothetical protein
MSQFTPEQIAKAKKQMRSNIHQMAMHNPMTDEQVKSAIERGDRVIDKMMALPVEEVESMSQTEMVEEAVEKLPEVKVEDRARIVVKSKKILADFEAPGVDTAMLILTILCVGLGLGLWFVAIYRAVA